jgi:hypothetical protein
VRNRLSASELGATATPATVATPESTKVVTVASVATVAVAKPENSKASEPVAADAAIADPAGRCPDCGSGQWWQLPGEPWHCHHCEPLSGEQAAVLRRDSRICREIQAPPVRDARRRGLPAVS